MIRNTCALLLIIAVLLTTAACSSTGKVDLDKLPDPPSTKALVDAHNQRLEKLDTLWARVSVRAKGTYDDGTTYEEQGEGHLQIVRPDRISLSIGKLGETYFVFGASETQYWSFNLADADRKVMLVGAMDKVTRGKAAALGLPVHPSELIPLSGLSRIELAQAGGTRWRDDGKAVGFVTPARWGTTATWFDPSSMLVVQTQAFDDQGQLIATAELSRYKDASIPGEAPVQVPGKIEVTTPGDDGFVRIETSGPEAREIRSMVFEPDRLRRAYRADEVIDLDERPEATPATEVPAAP